MGGAGAGGGWSDSAHYHPRHLSLHTAPHIGTVLAGLVLLPPGGAISGLTYTNPIQGQLDSLQLDSPKE